jgi:tetratricopeptide (TPR) repeat protein
MRRLLIGTIACLFLMTACQPTKSPPRIDLSGLEQPAATLIQEQLAAVKAQPRSASAWANLGYTLRNYRFAHEALSCFAHAELLDAKNPRWPYFQALLLATENSTRALEKNRRAVELCGSEPEMPRYRLTMALAEAGLWEEATQQAQELLRAKPAFAPAILLTARAAAAKGDLTNAIALARQCLDDGRTVRSATTLLASLYLQIGDISNAQKLSQLSEKLPPDEPIADPFVAEAALFRRDYRALAEQSHPLLAAGRTNEAGLLIRRLEKEYPAVAETWLLSGRLALLSKDFARARTALEQHLQMEPTSSQGFFQLGLAQLAQRQHAQAAESFREATRLKADFGAAYYNHGLAVVRSGTIKEAIPSFEQAVRLNPERIDSYGMLAECLFRSGEKQRALETLNQGATLNPSHPAISQLRKRIGTP